MTHVVGTVPNYYSSKNHLERANTNSIMLTAEGVVIGFENKHDLVCELNAYNTRTMYICICNYNKMRAVNIHWLNMLIRIEGHWSIFV